jgi:hypothetical protein
MAVTVGARRCSRRDGEVQLGAAGAGGLAEPISRPHARAGPLRGGTRNRILPHWRDATTRSGKTRRRQSQPGRPGAAARQEVIALPLWYVKWQVER